MATGYTAGVEDGTVTDFKDFCLRCARSIDYLADIRDEALDAPISDSFGADNHHTKRLLAEKEELARLEAMKAPEIDAAYENWRARLEREQQNSVATVGLRNSRYYAMLAKVHAWMPPSKKHEGLKKFMIEQLTGGIYTYDPVSFEDQHPADWHAANIEHCKREIAYHAKEEAKERQRAEERTTWVKQLKESLK